MKTLFLIVAFVFTAGAFFTAQAQHQIHVDHPPHNGIYVERPQQLGIRVDSAAVGGAFAFSQSDGLIIAENGANGVSIFKSGSNGMLIKNSEEQAILIDSTRQNGLVIQRIAESGIHLTEVDSHGIFIDEVEDDAIRIAGAQIGIHMTGVEDGMTILSPEGFGINIESSFGNGLQIGSSGQHGVRIRNTESNGVDISGTAGHGVQIHDGGSNGINIDSCNLDGVRVQKAANFGLYSLKSGSHGLYLAESGGRGVFVDRTQDRGVHVFEAGSHGIHIDQAGNKGAYIEDSGSHGIHVHQAGSHGMLIEDSNADGLVIRGAIDDGINIDSIDDDGITLTNITNTGIHVNGTGGSAGIFINNPSSPNSALVASHSDDNKTDLKLLGEGRVEVDSDCLIQLDGQDALANAVFMLRSSDGTVPLIASEGGDLSILGNLSKGGGSFKIDHPLDPENKYLYHSFVESPDMMNIYNGNVVLDKNGQANIEMPTWFEALNRDFRYQLTPIGAAADLYVAHEMKNGSFSIAGGTAGLKVSWQVTGIRHDPYANHHRVPVEVEKEVEKRGTYLHPQVYQSSKSFHVNREKTPRLP